MPILCPAGVTAFSTTGIGGYGSPPSRGRLVDRAPSNVEKRHDERVGSRVARSETKAGASLAGELGFEPRQTESESVVLPLHHSPTDFRTNSIGCGIVRQLSASASLKKSALLAMRPSTRKRPELASVVAQRLLWLRGLATPDFPKASKGRSGGAVALFHDERRGTPMTVVASCRSSVDDNRSASLPTRRTSLAYPRGNCRGSIDKLSSERRGSAGSRNLPPPTGHVMLMRQNNNKRRALARSVAKSRHRGYVSETNG